MRAIACGQAYDPFVARQAGVRPSAAYCAEKGERLSSFKIRRVARRLLL
jgi:hypothetical protein